MLHFLSLLWCVSSFDGTMPSILAIVEAMTRLFRRCHRKRGPLGLIASTIVGALFCEVFGGVSHGARYALLDRTALVFLALCGGLTGSELLANCIISIAVAALDVL